ncbi:MAG: glycosyltransferase family 2 protein [Sinimarinibacterium sp.]|jgi:glycosyltransferase Alg8
MSSISGWLLYLGGLCLLAWSLPATAFDPEHAHYWIAIGAIAIWRYSLGALHFLRGMYFQYVAFPRARRAAAALGEEAKPPAYYLLITSFRIDPATTAAVYRAAIREAAASGVSTTIVASIVELADEQLIKLLWERLTPPQHVRLRIVRIQGTGKRDALAQGFRCISRDAPDADALVAVIDGDTVLDAGVLDRTAPYFRLYPRVGALTTNEFCDVRGGYCMREWHALRFAQRHINMCSMALSRRVLTLTGRMSVFRAGIVVHPGFIHDVQHDALDHWRLGRFRFLTGDDKSSWFSLMRLGWDTWYVPDASITTVEHPPDRSFLRASRQLMFRWYGNSLRQNSRATQLGVGRLGAFATYVLWDQRISMWTSLLGLSLALLSSAAYGIELLLGYLLWIGTSRLLLTLLLACSGHRVGPAFPLLLYYNQIVGSLMKIDVMFHLDRQSWTRQKTSLDRGLNPWQSALNRWTSNAMLASSVSLFLALVVTLI